MNATLIAAGALAAAAAAAPSGEMKAKVDALFSAADINADKTITEQEYVDYQLTRARADFAAMAGSDGALTADEATRHWEAKAAETAAKKPTQP